MVKAAAGDTLGINTAADEALVRGRRCLLTDVRRRRAKAASVKPTAEAVKRASTKASKSPTAGS